MADRNILKALAAALDTTPKKVKLDITIVNPSGAGSWVAGIDIGRPLWGQPADTPADALRNLFHLLTASQGYREDGEVQVALEMLVSGFGIGAGGMKELLTGDADDELTVED